jgi:glucose-1-phosphate adenylyltransferase
MDLLGECPIFDLRNTRWPILTDKYDGPAASLIRTSVDDALVEQSSRIVEAKISRSMIGRHVTIEQGAHIEESIIMDGAVIGAKARLRRTIVDRFNVIPAGTELGFDAAKDRARYHVTKSGLVVLPRGQRDRSRPSHAG